MNKKGGWALAPAYDLTCSDNTTGAWTATHQMTMNGKRDGFVLADFEACAKAALMKRRRAKTILGEVLAVVTRWAEFAAAAKLSDGWHDTIARAHRLSFTEK